MISLWSTDSGEIVKEFSGHDGPATAVVFSADESLLASVGRDYVLKVWSVKTQGLVASHKIHWENFREMHVDFSGKVTVEFDDGTSTSYAAN